MVWGAALVLGMASSDTWARKLDESLFEQSARDAVAQEGQWMSNWILGTGELGGWSVSDLDVSVVEEPTGPNHQQDDFATPPTWANPPGATASSPTCSTA